MELKERHTKEEGMHVNHVHLVNEANKACRAMMKTKHLVNTATNICTESEM